MPKNTPKLDYLLITVYTSREAKLFLNLNGSMPGF